MAMTRAGTATGRRLEGHGASRRDKANRCPQNEFWGDAQQGWQGAHRPLPASDTSRPFDRPRPPPKPFHTVGWTGRLFRLQGSHEHIGLGDGQFHVPHQLVDIGLHTGQLLAEAGNGPGIQVVLHEQNLVP